MPRLFTKSDSQSFVNPSEGSHVAALSCLAFLGSHLNTFSNKYQELVGLAWETQETDDDGRPLVALETLNYSMYERSKLYARLVALMGGKEPAPGFDFRNLLGRSAIVTVAHTYKGEKTFANITAAGPIPRGTAGHTPSSLVYFDLAEFDPAAYALLPKRFQKLTEAAQAQHPVTSSPPRAPVIQHPAAAITRPVPEADYSDIPF